MTINRLRDVFFILLLLPYFSVISEEITVLYPDVKPPYNKIFEQITSGIESSSDIEVIHLKLPKKLDIEKIQKQITTSKVIALGRRGLSVAKKIYQEKTVVVGAYPLKPNGVSGVTLMAEPTLLFDSLHLLAPHVETVTVVYSKYSKWMIAEASEKAKKQGLTLIPIFIEDLKSAAKAYDKIFEQHNEKNAIWLPLDGVSAHDKAIIPVILEKAWQNKIVVFSSKPTHAKRGALFATLPDNTMLGEQLAKLVSNNTLTSKSEIHTLENAKLAVNLRTAAHLGYRYSSAEQADFALTFPSRND